MIPKIIHYCWFGGKPLPPSANKYIESWRSYLPDYEIRRWDESNFDINQIPYTKEAYAAKKYAFVSDYARFWILYNYGGLYFDTDVEVISSLDDIIKIGQFMGVEQQDKEKITVNPGLGVGAIKGNELFKYLIEQYSKLHFINPDGSLCLKNVVEITTECLLTRSLENVDKIQYCGEFYIYPKEYFCPLDYNTRKMDITINTKTIHHYAESWVPRYTRIINALGRVFGQRFIQELVRIKRLLKEGNDL